MNQIEARRGRCSNSSVRAICVKYKLTNVLAQSMFEGCEGWGCRVALARRGRRDISEGRRHDVTQFSANCKTNQVNRQSKMLQPQIVPKVATGHIPLRTIDIAHGPHKFVGFCSPVPNSAFSSPGDLKDRIALTRRTGPRQAGLGTQNKRLGLLFKAGVSIAHGPRSKSRA